MKGQPVNILGPAGDRVPVEVTPPCCRCRTGCRQYGHSCVPKKLYKQVAAGSANPWRRPFMALLYHFHFTVFLDLIISFILTFFFTSSLGLGDIGGLMLSAFIFATYV